MSNFILEFLFPRFCIGCRKMGKYICDQCKNDIYIFPQDHCVGCGRVSAFGTTHELCKSKTPFDGAFHLYQYRGLMRKAVRQAKYHQAYAIYEELCGSVKSTLLEHIVHYGSTREEVLLVPIPLHKNRQNQRGYNQSMILATEIAKITKIPIVEVLERVIDTQSQVETKNRTERVENIHGAFALRKHTPPGRTYILIDDLFTTGSTSTEAAHLLKQQKAKVYVCTLAHG